MEKPGSTTVTKLKAWINHLKSKNLDDQVPVDNAATEVTERDIEKHITSLKVGQEKQENEQKKRRLLLEKHLAAIKVKRNKKKVYNSLSLIEKRIAQALIDWSEKQKNVSDGLLELCFKKKVLVKINFEKITGEFDSTLKIKKMKGSEKLKEMLLIFKRGKNLLLDFYSRDLRENIYTFMFLNGKIQSYEKSSEIANVIGYFQEFFE
ncbi:hypothetical protein [Candidatus Uabimicrobium sp. HlEnr_7]|uniref:hypothetical protein n=1 Tax=Candidatus Uabimicrobium helgolandensis TaxID=3095367 RepID=UPI003557E8FF